MNTKSLTILGNSEKDVAVKTVVKPGKVVEIFNRLSISISAPTPTANDRIFCS
jgi:hypothetical protein